MADLQIVMAGEIEKKVEAQYVEMKVPLYSYGCEKKIKKALAHLKGIYSIQVSFAEQKVTVWGICNKYDVLDTIRNKRKDALFWNAEDNLVLAQQQENEKEPEKDTIAAEVGSSFSSSSLRRKAKRLVPPLTLIRCRSSLTWKAWKNVFIRSYSF
ncbi:HMA domain-containing protein [Heracleum sosnowskyi]|uniref:HMA domain-containing protein n=1 Tax=Heracleum sosnowskyi TaxID=360622 RepID=A0AAD8MBR9_9APIA|nr:HMA domain-containing protein [Heracleum sosnowskyi]